MAKKPVSTPKAASTKKANKTSAAPAPQDLESAWSQSRSRPPQKGGYEVADIPDGDYAVQVQSAKCAEYKSGNKKGTRYFVINYVVAAGPYTGVQLRSSDDVSTREVGNQGRTAMDLLSDRLQKMNINISGMKLAQLPSLAQALGDTNSEIGRMFLSVTVQNNPVTKDDGTTVVFQNVYANEPLDAASVNQLKKALA